MERLCLGSVRQHLSSRASTSDPAAGSTPFLPLRGHFFHQVVNGLWCCVNRGCEAKRGTPLEENWPFGYVYAQRKSVCSCSAPIYELVFCQECGSPHLTCVESGGSFAVQEPESIDEFSLEIDAEEHEEAISSYPRAPALLTNTAHEELTYPVSINSRGDAVAPGMDTFGLMYSTATTSNVLTVSMVQKRLLFSGGHAWHSLLCQQRNAHSLDLCQDGDRPNDQPSRGRRLITFTDSRQGTARMSAKLQQDSERVSIEA